LLFILALPFLAGKRDESRQTLQTQGLEAAAAKNTAIEHLGFQVDSTGKASLTFFIRWERKV
jgi:hypothetical protein